VKHLTWIDQLRVTFPEAEFIEPMDRYGAILTVVHGGVRKRIDRVFGNEHAVLEIAAFLSGREAQRRLSCDHGELGSHPTRLIRACRSDVVEYRVDEWFSTHGPGFGYNPTLNRYVVVNGCPFHEVYVSRWSFAVPDVAPQPFGNGYASISKTINLTHDELRAMDGWAGAIAELRNAIASGARPDVFNPLERLPV
jgi:hypothetical protein